jgi:hypothetical protein
MLWTSLRFGWGNTGPMILLGLVPVFAAAANLQRQPAPHELIVQILTPYETTAPTWTCDLAPGAASPRGAS